MVLIHWSGTELIIRIILEGENYKNIKNLSNNFINIINNEFKSM